MQWTKIPTNLITGDYTDAEILAIVKYQLVYALDEVKPSERKLKKFLNKNQTIRVQKFINDITTSVERDINSITKIKNRNARYYNKTNTLRQNQETNSDVLQDVTDKIREDKIREEKEKIYKKENPDLMFSSELGECFSFYSDICKKLIPLGFERRNKEILSLLDDVLEEINRDFEVFKELCIKANDLVTIAEKKIDFKMMLRNYVGILNGKYKAPNILDGLDFG